MADPVPSRARGEEETVLEERLRYRAWMTALLWSGLACVVFKEWQYGTWEDVAGAWSAIGLAAYGYFKWRPPQGEDLPEASPWWVAWSWYGVGGGLIVLAMFQFLGGLPSALEHGSSLRWIGEFLDRWKLPPDGDWLGLALTILLLATIVTREECLSTPRSNN